MTRSARRTKRRSRAWMWRCGCLSTQPWWRPYSVACTVTTSGRPAWAASASPARPTSQSCPWIRSKSSSAQSSRPRSFMSRFIRSTQARNASRSAGCAPSSTRWTSTPRTVSRPVPPRVRTWTSTPSATSPSDSLRTWRASPPSTIGGYSQERIRTRPGTRRPSLLAAERGAILDPAALGAECDRPAAHHARPERPVALDLEPVALPQRRRTGGEARVEVAQQFAGARGERDEWRLGPGDHAEPVVERVDVRAQYEEVVRGLHRREAVAPDEDGAGALEHADGGAHRRLDLHDRRRRGIRGIDGLLVADERQPEHAVARGERVAQDLEIDPEVVRVEEPVARDVAERVLVLLARLRALAEHELAVGAAHGEVAALAVGLGAGAGLRHERDALARHPAEDPRLERRPEVVRVRDERVPVATLEERVQHPRGEQRGVEVAVAGRAPLEVRVLGPLDRLERAGRELRLAVLDEVERHVGLEVGMGLERGERVVPGDERVHEHERYACPGGPAQGEHLARDDVEERAAVLDLDERLGPVHSHRGAEPAVQLDDDGPVEGCVVTRGEVVERRELLDRLEVVLGELARLSRLDLAVEVGEGAHGGGRDTGLLHLAGGGLEAGVAHGRGSVGSSSSRRDSRWRAIIRS